MVKEVRSEGVTITEPAREVPIVAQADVVVAGGGPAGIAAARAAARRGADTVLLERYGHLGGQATGGLVLVFIRWDDGHRQVASGISEEMIQRRLEQIRRRLPHGTGG